MCASGMQEGRVSACLFPAVHAAGGGSHKWERKAVPSPKAVGNANLGKSFQATGHAKVRHMERMEEARRAS